MTTYTIGIVTHPARRDMAETLAQQVNADLICYDHEHNGERWCHTQALRGLLEIAVACGDNRPDWLVLLEDDALPIDDFKASLHRALHATHFAIISLYLGQGNWAGVPRSQADTIESLVATADQTGAAWITTNALYHAVGLAIPTDWASSIIAYLEESTRPTDRTISGWARDNNKTVRYTWPSIIDHADGPSLIRNRTPRIVERKAWKTGPWT